MIKVVLFFILLIIGGMVSAQNRKINLRNTAWNQVLEEAGREKKIIFVVCHAEWCNPCKALVKNVFSRDAVADFYNGHFVCVSCDVDKDEIPRFVNIPQTKAVPLLLFVDPDTKTVVHGRLGTLDEAGMLKLGETALNDKWNLAGMDARFQRGEVNEALIIPYLGILNNLGYREKYKEILTGYFNLMTVECLMVQENWNLFEREVYDPFMPIFRLAWNARDQIAERIGQKRVNEKLDQVLLQQVENRVRRVDWGQIEENYRGLVGLRDYVVTLDWKQRDFSLFVLNMAGQIHRKEYDEVLGELKRFLREYGTEDQKVITYVYIFCEKLKARANPRQIMKGIEYVDQVVAGKEKGVRSYFLYLKRDMLKAAGREKEAMQVDSLATKILNPHFYNR